MLYLRQRVKRPFQAKKKLGKPHGSELAYGGDEPLLISAAVVPKAAKIDVLSEADSAASATAVLLRAAYRNEAHDKLPRAQWQEFRTDLTWLSPCRPIRSVPFHDIFAIMSFGGLMSDYVDAEEGRSD